jgi:hypothetical protein
MDLVHALAAGGLAARATDRRFTTDEGEVRAAERRAVARREALVAARRPEYSERGRHVAPRPLSA